MIISYSQHKFHVYGSIFSITKIQGDFLFTLAPFLALKC